MNLFEAACGPATAGGLTAQTTSRAQGPSGPPSPGPQGHPDRWTSQAGKRRTRTPTSSDQNTLRPIASRNDQLHSGGGSRLSCPTPS
jgi:hypothetical protein